MRWRIEHVHAIALAQRVVTTDVLAHRPTDDTVWTKLRALQPASGESRS